MMRSLIPHRRLLRLITLLWVLVAGGFSVAPPAAADGTVRVVAVDDAGARSTCACFKINGSPTAVGTCDAGSAGVLDGVTTFAAVKPGSYQLAIKNALALGYQDIDTQTITRLDGQVLSVTINLRRLITL